MTWQCWKHLQEKTYHKIESHESLSAVCWLRQGHCICSAWLCMTSDQSPVPGGGGWWRQRAGSLWSLQHRAGQAPGPADINQTPAPVHRPQPNSVIWQELIGCFQMSKEDKIFALQNTYYFFFIWKLSCPRLLLQWPVNRKIKFTERLSVFYHWWWIWNRSNHLTISSQ